MTTLNLNHSSTPTALRDLNEKIVAQLSDTSETDFSLLNRLIEERDTLVKNHLESLNDNDKQEFAKQELGVNNRINELVQSLLVSIKDDITNFVRRKTAAKQYK